jgi:anti-sigma B factor antagonist
MNTWDRSREADSSYQCPVCGLSLPHFYSLCIECGCYFWCRKRESNGEVILEALPGRTPEPAEVEQVAQSLVESGPVDCVLVDLSDLEFVTSAFMARLITMKKRIQAAGGRLYLCGLNPVVREILERVRLDKAFDIVDREERDELVRA